MTDSRYEIARIDAELWRKRAQKLEARFTKLAEAAESALLWIGQPAFTEEQEWAVDDVRKDLAAALALPKVEPTKEGEPSVHQDAS